MDGGGGEVEARTDAFTERHAVRSGQSHVDRLFLWNALVAQFSALSVIIFYV